MGPAPSRGTGQSETVKHVLSEWSWGHLSAPQVQTLALKAYHDQIALLRRLNLSEDHAHDDLKSLAKLGNWGAAPNNIEQQLLTFLGEPRTPPYQCFPVTVATTKARVQSGESQVQYTEDIQFPMLLPHVLFCLDVQQQPEALRAVLPRRL